MVQRVVVIGAGFGGLAAMRALRHADADLVLVDRANHHLFQPLLYQVATAALSPADIATASRALLRGQKNASVVLGEVTGIDSAARRVQIADAPDLPYDHLIIATGSAYGFFGHPEWGAHAGTLKSLDDAVSIRSRLLAAFEYAERCDDSAERARLLTFVVVGGGPTGVELAGTIAELTRTTLKRDFRHIDPATARIVLCEAGPDLLTAFPARLRRYARKALGDLGVQVMTGAKVAAVDERGLQAGDARIDAGTVLWAAGTEARPAAKWLHAATGHGGTITVGPDCSVPGHPDVYAIGDVASQTGADGKPLPGLAAVAKQQGAYLGRKLAAKLSGQKDPGPFRYRDLGTMAVIGRSRAVAHLPFLSLTGLPAWLLWCLVHLMLLVDFRSRRAVYVNWSWSWLSYGRSARLITRAGLKPAP